MMKNKTSNVENKRSMALGYGFVHWFLVNACWPRLLTERLVLWLYNCIEVRYFWNSSLVWRRNLCTSPFLHFTPTFDSIGWLKHDPYTLHPLWWLTTLPVILPKYLQRISYSVYTWGRSLSFERLPDPMTLRLSIVAWGHQDTSTFPWSPWQKDGSPAAKEGRSKSEEHLPNLCCSTMLCVLLFSTDFN